MRPSKTDESFVFLLKITGYIEAIYSFYSFAQH